MNDMQLNGKSYIFLCISRVTIQDLFQAISSNTWFRKDMQYRFHIANELEIYQIYNNSHPKPFESTYRSEVGNV